MKVKNLPPADMDTSLGDELIASLTEGMAILRGEAEPARLHPAPDVPDVGTLRKRLKLTQAAFARRFGFTLGAVRDWEQHRYQPDQTARSYLRVIDREPEAVARALSGQVVEPVDTQA